MNPFVFIVGCPRSGTTLVRRLVDAHPQIAIPKRESHWIPKVIEAGRLSPRGEVTSTVLDDLRADHRFHRFMELLPDAEEAMAALASELPLSYPRFVTRVFDLHGRAWGKPLVGDKTPGYVRHLPTLSALWPEARFVHLIRDGRDVALSALSWSRGPVRLASWKDDPVTTAAIWWEGRVRRGRADGLPLGPGRYYELRYESLVADPEAECRALCDFLDVPFDGAMLRFHEGRGKDDPALSAKKAWRPVTSGLRDWSGEMPSDDVERFEAAAGDLLEELCYPRAVPRPPSAALENAKRVRELLAGGGHVRASDRR